MKTASENTPGARAELPLIQVKTGQQKQSQTWNLAEKCDLPIYLVARAGNVFWIAEQNLPTVGFPGISSLAASPDEQSDIA